MPAAVLFGLVSFSVGWLLFSRDSNDLMIGFLVGGGWLILAGILGGIPLGNTGRNDSSLAMRHFTAALPISDQELARTTLRTTAASTLFAWLLWAVAFALSYTVLATMGAVDLALVDYPKDFHWWAYLPATLLGIWVAASTVTAIGLADLSRFWLKAFVTLIATIILLNILDSVVSHLLPLGMADLLIRSFVGTFLGGVVFTTAGMFAVARSHQMVPSTSVWLVTAAAIAVAVVACIYWPAHLRPFWLAALLVAAAYSLAVAPLAAFPLAISANRHR